MGYAITEMLIPVNQFSRPGAGITSVRGLVIHWTSNTDAGADAEANARYFANLKDQDDPSNATYASAHYEVDDHSIIRTVPENEMAYHVGAHQYNQDTLKLLNTTYPNNCTIGIEWCVNQGNDFNETYKRVAWLAADICRRYGLNPLTQMIRHYDVTWKDCPHFFTPNATNGNEGWAQFRQYVYNLLHAPTYSVSPLKGLCEAATDLNVRSGPGADTDKVTTIPSGMTIGIVGQTQVDGVTWYKTSYGDGGFVSGHYVKGVRPVNGHFFDTQSHWAHDAVEHLANLGLIATKDANGNLVQNFHPDANITRAEMAAIVSRVLTMFGK